MKGPIIANTALVTLVDIVHLAANIAFFVIGFSIEISPTAAFIYMPLMLIGLWSAFFGLRSYLVSQQAKYTKRQAKPKVKAKASTKPLTAVLES
ncbi:MAG: hypothetical protein HWE16_00545 [Gammaproteobacteria bacterium]|nr:hypothetical protein [Gammaproteobacteria bacterium]